MKKSIGIMIATILLGSMLPWAVMPEHVAAAANVSVTMEIPLRLTAAGQDVPSAGTGDALAAEVFTLTAADADAPMPADAAGGVKKLTLREATETTFGPIRYEQPGVYDYTVQASQADAPVYQVRIVAASDGQGSLIVRRAGEEGKTELVYQGIPAKRTADAGELTPEGVLGISPAVHRSEDAGPGQERQGQTGQAIAGRESPRTGDATPLILWILLGTGSLLTLCFLLAAVGLRPRRHAAGLRPGLPRVGFRIGPSAIGSSGLGAARRRKCRRASLCILLMVCLILPATEDCFGASTKVTLHRHGTCKDCGAKRGDDKSGWTKITYDDGVGVTYFRWISYVDPATGKKHKVDTYCMEPSKSSPGAGARTAVLLDAAKSGKQQNISRVLYFADGGPGQEVLQDYLKKNQSTYPDFQTAKGRYGMMHILLSYAADPDAAFEVKDRGGNTSRAVNGQLSSGFQKKIRKLYQWCQKNAVIVTKPSFAIKPAAATAKLDAAAGGYLSQQMRVTGSDSRQYFRYKVPAKAQLLLTHGKAETSYGAGSTVAIHVGDRFRILLDESRITGLTKKTVTGELSKLKPYRIRSSGSQDLGFYSTQTSVTAEFSVAMVRGEEESGEDSGGTDPADPGDPTDPTDLSDPDDPDKPGDADDPDDPDNPGDPDDPAWPAGDSEAAVMSGFLPTHTLQITKRLQATSTWTGQRFSFQATLHGLIRDRYLAVKAGAATATISADPEGNIAVTVGDSAWMASRNGELGGIPVKFSRSDGETRTLFTDEAGRIAAEDYTGWLRETADDHRFWVEFLQRTYEEAW